MRSDSVLAYVTAVLFLLACNSSYAQQSPAPDFIPDGFFQGENLSDWQSIGQAKWQADKGVITGTAKAGGGWLIFNRSYQDAALFTRFRCQGQCDAGVLLRAEDTADGRKGILLSLEKDTVAPYRVTFDESGRMLSKESARDPETWPGNDMKTGSDFARHRWAKPVQIETGQWNSIEIFMDGNYIYNHLNGMRNLLKPGVAKPGIVPTLLPFEGKFTDIYNYSEIPDLRYDEITQDDYGPIGLYVGSGKVKFDNIAVKDLNTVTVEPERSSSRFRVQRLNDFAYSWGIDAADLDRDGVTDIIAGPYYFLGPDYTTRRTYYPPRTYNPGLEFLQDHQTFAHDWTGDGWVDVLNNDRQRPLLLRVNPKGENRRWDRVESLPQVMSELVRKEDIDNDGLMEMVFVTKDCRLSYGEPDPSDPRAPWLVRTIHETPMSIFSVIHQAPICMNHGLGVGDINGDGLTDVLHTNGWWEQPATNPAGGNWRHHEIVFGRPPTPYGGGIISVYDFNGDGLNDVVASLEAHGWGLAWYEQQRNAAGEISFEQHMIMDNFATKNAGDVTFSQLHSGAVLADIDNDGIMDFVTGKRHWAHLDTFQDPDHNGEAVLYWYRTVRNADAPGGVEFVPELIHNKSGVGSEFKALDINRDGAVDIITATTRGAFVFWGIPSGG